MIEQTPKRWAGLDIFDRFMMVFLGTFAFCGVVLTVTFVVALLEVSCS